MNTHHAIAAIAAAGSLFAGAQNVTEDPKADLVPEATQAFKTQDKKPPNEITVVLDPIGERPHPVAADAESDIEPVLITGTLLEENERNQAELEVTTPAAISEAERQNPPRPQTGLAVRIEKLQTGQGTVDPSQIKLLAPFPAKPLAQPPAGWLLEASESAPPFTRKVELAPGSEITLTVRPHLLVPDANGADVFTIAEPGYESSLGYQQTAIVGAILSKSIRQLDDDSKQLGIAIDRLQQLLISLPKPETEPQPKAAPAPTRKR
jgi:phenylpyruvate tautomerase PptA (4-oxalocrotonate tautomerase family)